MALVGSTILRCPVCGRELPPVQILLRQQATSEDRRVSLTISIEPVMDEEWHARVRDEHRECVDGR